MLEEPFSTQGFIYGRANPLLYVDPDGTRDAFEWEQERIERIEADIQALDAVWRNESLDTVVREEAYRLRYAAKDFLPRCRPSISWADEGEAVHTRRLEGCRARIQGLEYSQGELAPAIALDECTKTYTDSELGRVDAFNRFVDHPKTQFALKVAKTMLNVAALATAVGALTGSLLGSAVVAEERALLGAEASARAGAEVASSSVVRGRVLGALEEARSAQAANSARTADEGLVPQIRSS